MDCLFSAYKQFRDKGKTPPAFFLMEAIFWLMAFFCEYAEIAPKCVDLFNIYCAYCCHFLFSFFLIQK